MKIIDSANIEIRAYSNTHIENKINRFGSLPTGWHFGEGRPPSDQRIRQGISIANEAIFHGYDVDAFPGIGGEILITLYYENDYFEFTIEENDTVTFVHERDGQEVENRENLPINDILKLIWECGESCRSSDSFTRNTMTSDRKDSRVWHLETMDREYQLFLGTAYSHWDIASAIIS